MKRVLALILFLLIAVFFAACESPVADPFSIVKEGDESILEKISGSERFDANVDYSDQTNWYAFEKDPQKSVDVIYFCPLIYSAPENGNEISSIDDAGMRAAAPAFLESQAAVFADRCNIYAPFCRQFDLTFLASLSRAERDLAYGLAASRDAAAALDYYFSTANGGRPFILAGHGQGSDVLRMILGVYMKDHPEIYERMIAAYIPGTAVTKPFLNKYPHLKFAKGADDTGVIVSYNTEGPGNYSSDADFLIYYKQTLVINPLSWKTDEGLKNTSGEDIGEYVFPSKNLGMRLPDGTIVPGIVDARIDRRRGTVVCDNEDLSKYACAERLERLFGPQSYHEHDYDFYFENLKENVGTRIDAYERKH